MALLVILRWLRVVCDAITGVQPFEFVFPNSTGRTPNCSDELSITSPFIISFRVYKSHELVLVGTTAVKLPYS